MRCRTVKKNPLYGLKKGKRTLVFLLESPKGSPAAEGILHVNFQGDRDRSVLQGQRVVSIKNGRGTLELDTPVELKLLCSNGWDIAGYLPKHMSCPAMNVSHVKPKEWYRQKLLVTTGDKALEIRFSLEPSGLIRGTLKTSTGALAHDMAVGQMSYVDRMEYLKVDQKTATYLLRNIRLNTPTVVKIPGHRGVQALKSKPIILTADHPIQTVDLTYPPQDPADPNP